MTTQPVRRHHPWWHWLVLVILLIATLVLLFEVVFPWVEVHVYNPTVGQTSVWSQR